MPGHAGFLLSFLVPPVDFARPRRRASAMSHRQAVAPAYDQPNGATLSELGIDASEGDSV